VTTEKYEEGDTRIYTLPDRWILTRLGQVSEDVSRAIEGYRFNDAAGLCYQFIWHEFCDWYLEMAKESLYGEDRAMKASSGTIVQEVLKAVLKLLHPFMPFVTEEIWQKLPGTEGSIMIARFPDASHFLNDEEAIREMDLLMGAITGIRNIRGEMNIPPSRRVNVVIDVAGGKEGDVLRMNLAHIQTLAKVNEVSIDPGAPKPEASATTVFGRNQVHVLLKGLLDFEEERKRLRKGVEKIEKDMQVAARKLSNKGFLEKAPAEIVAEVKEKVETLNLKIEKLNQNLRFFETIDN